MRTKEGVGRGKIVISSNPGEFVSPSVNLVPVPTTINVNSVILLKIAMNMKEKEIANMGRNVSSATH